MLSKNDLCLRAAVHYMLLFLVTLQQFQLVSKLLHALTPAAHSYALLMDIINLDISSLVWPHPIPQGRERIWWPQFVALLCTVRDQPQCSILSHECCYHNFNRKLQVWNKLWNHKQLLCQSYAAQCCVNEIEWLLPSLADEVWSILMMMCTI